MIIATASELKMKLGKFMQAIRDGREVIVLDRGKRLARLTPYDGTVESALCLVKERDESAPLLGEVVVKKVRTQSPADSMQFLTEDRSR